MSDVQAKDIRQSHFKPSRPSIRFTPSTHCTSHLPLPNIRVICPYSWQCLGRLLRTPLAFSRHWPGQATPTWSDFGLPHVNMSLWSIHGSLVQPWLLTILLELQLLFVVLGAGLTFWGCADVPSTLSTDLVRQS